MLLQSPALSSPPRSVQVAQPWGRGVGQQSLIFSSLTNLKLFFFFFGTWRFSRGLGLPRLCFQMHRNHHDIFLWNVEVCELNVGLKEETQGYKTEIRLLAELGDCLSGRSKQREFLLRGGFKTKPKKGTCKLSLPVRKLPRCLPSLSQLLAATCEPHMVTHTPLLHPAALRAVRDIAS